MAQVIKTNKDINIRAGDPIEFTIMTEGDVKAEVGDLAKFIIKENIADPDNAAILVKEIAVDVPNEICIFIDSTETADIEEGKYKWSVKHYKGDTYYTIIPDSTTFRDKYPQFIVQEALLDD